MNPLQRRFERVLEYFVQGDLDVKMKRMSVIIWILIALGVGAMFWAANLKVQDMSVWRVLFNKRF